MWGSREEYITPGVTFLFVFVLTTPGDFSFYRKGDLSTTDVRGTSRKRYHV